MTEAEEVLNLLKQTNEEVKIDSKYDEDNKNNEDGMTVQEKIDDMQTRLYKLKGINPGMKKLKHGNES